MLRTNDQYWAGWMISNGEIIVNITSGYNKGWVTIVG